jgi:hypothetical protein
VYHNEKQLLLLLWLCYCDPQILKCRRSMCHRKSSSAAVMLCRSLLLCCKLIVWLCVTSQPASQFQHTPTCVATTFDSL